jgi:putative transcriptional regulator
MIRHHPSDATVTAYAAGSLPEGLALVVATHLTACPACRRLGSTAESIGGVMLEDLPPAAMAADALDRVLARSEVPVPPAPPRPTEPGLPPPLDRCTFGAWWRLGGGIRWRPLQVGGGAWAGLLQLQPGRALPLHGHAGRELACVLSGAFIDGDGHYAAGDLAEPDTGADHQPRVDGSEPCLCVIAAEGVRLRGLLGLAQRLIGR